MFTIIMMKLETIELMTCSVLEYTNTINSKLSTIIIKICGCLLRLDKIIAGKG